MKNIKPTFGVSFGLPNQGGGGYPISPYGPNTLVNPYGNTIGGSGINLGLVSVNPLISVQVSKDDYGNKEIKPFVNLHVTPNNYLVHKFEDLLSYKKHIIFNKHKHYHLHKAHPHYYQSHYENHPHHEFYKPPSHVIETPEIYGPQHYTGPYLDHPPAHSSSYPGEHFYPPHSLSAETYPGPEAYYDDPLNYGGGEYDPHHGRAYVNKTNYVQGNSLLEQFQNKYQNGDNTYANYNDDSNLHDNHQNNFDSYQYSSDKRRGKSFNFQNDSPSNPIKFPSSRKRRDVSQGESFKHNITKVVYHFLIFEYLTKKQLLNLLLFF